MEIERGSLELDRAIGDALDAYLAQLHLIAGEGACLVAEDVFHSAKILIEARVAGPRGLSRHRIPNRFIKVDENEGLPEFDDLQRDKKRNGHQVGVQNPVCDHEDDCVHEAVLVVALHKRVEAQVGPQLAGMLAPDVGCDAAEEDHADLQDDDQADLHVEEGVK